MKIQMKIHKFKIIEKLGKKRIVLAALALLLAVTLSSAAVTSFTVTNNKFKDIRVYLSPSNQYSNQYAKGNTTEKEQCEKIAAATADKLKNYGFTVMIGKSGDTMQNRCSESDSFNADMHIPIHTNALDGSYTGGTRVYVYGADHQDAAQCMLDSVGAISPGEDDKIDYKPDLYEICTPQAETVYVECEFHDTVTGAEWIENNTQNIAQAIAEGVYNYYSQKEK